MFVFFCGFIVPYMFSSYYSYYVLTEFSRHSCMLPRFKSRLYSMSLCDIHRKLFRETNEYIRERATTRGREADY